ncbi:hypothetical protein M9H77_35922 [Catharanthus roseus]|uniref:Uncharacterized protein n=1 Tax=Catharanthus roseus TaxID=4058 RepID=A0ACB9ZSJ9_CATRO|nr:hypothetical protein M9H77_35922 [Catharanthus roseus]
MEVGADGVAVITIYNPLVNALAILGINFLANFQLLTPISFHLGIIKSSLALVNQTKEEHSEKRGLDKSVKKNVCSSKDGASPIYHSCSEAKTNTPVTYCTRPSTRHSTFVEL